MEEERYTAARIAEILSDALEVQKEDRKNLQHRVRYLAKRHYLSNGRKIDKRGTLDFPASEVFRTAILCEFLGLSVDMAVAFAALQEAENLLFALGKFPVSTMREGGFSFGSGLETAVRGVAAGEEWLLLVELRRSGLSGAAGVVGRYVLKDDERPNVDHIFGRAAVATTLTVNLKTLFSGIIERL